MNPVAFTSYAFQLAPPHHEAQRVGGPGLHAVRDDGDGLGDGGPVGEEHDGGYGRGERREGSARGGHQGVAAHNFNLKASFETSFSLDRFKG